MLFSVLGLPFLPTYNDYQFKLASKLGASDEFYLIGLGSFDYNRLNTGLKDPDDDQKYILGYLPENRQSSYVFGAGYVHRFRAGQLRVVVSRNAFTNKLYKHERNDKSLPRTIDYNTEQSDNRVRAEIELRSVGGFRFTGGVGGGSGHYDNTTRRPAYTGGQLRTERFDSRLSFGRYELFATLSREFFGKRFSVLLGLRADGTTYSSEMHNPLRQLSPRLNLSYNFRPQWTFSASVARYYQEPPYTSMGYRDSTGVLINKANGLRYIASDHFIAGIAFTPDAHSRISVEGFYKRYSDYPVSLIDSLPVSTGDFADYTIGDVPVRSVGKGRAYGVELSYRNTNLANTVVNVSYTFLHSQFNRPGADLRPTDEYVSSDWDVRHILNVSAIHKVRAQLDARRQMVSDRRQPLHALRFRPLVANRSLGRPTAALLRLRAVQFAATAGFPSARRAGGQSMVLREMAARILRRHPESLQLQSGRAGYPDARDRRFGAIRPRSAAPRTLQNEDRRARHRRHRTADAWHHRRILTYRTQAL